MGQPRQAVPRGYGGPLVHGDRLRRRGTRPGRRGADQETLVLAVVRGQDPRAERAAGGKAQVDDAVRRGTGLLWPVRLRRERHPDQADVVLPQPDRQTGKEEDHLAPGRLSRPHGRHRQPHGFAAVPRALRPADRGNPPHRESPLLSRRGGRASRRMRSPRGLAQELDDLIVAEGPETVAAFIAEPILGGRRRHRAAGRLLRKDTGGAGQARRIAHRRRGDLRIRSHGQPVRRGRPWACDRTR